MSRRRKKLPIEPVCASIESLSHDGRGVAHVGGKVVFISRALPGEEVMFRYTQRRSKFDLGEAMEILQASPQRIEPRCPHFGVCGGCALQHLSPEDQIASKQTRLLDSLTHLGKVEPETVLVPLTAEPWAYRRKARLGVHYMRREQVVRVGFRERSSKFLTDAKRCDVLHSAVGERIEALAQLVNSLSVRDKVPQIEVAIGDEHAALVFRHLDALSGDDQQKLIAFGEGNNLTIFTQSGGPQTIQRIYPEATAEDSFYLSYRLPNYEVELQFQPTDFTQVNAPLNRKMIDHTVEMLDLQADDRVLDLFCGLGNFSLPLARCAGGVVGIEGEASLVERAWDNARRNGLDNLEFHAADLTGDLAVEPWYGKGFNKLLLDPPRSGAAVVVENLPMPFPERIVYVSCDPATLARDAGTLVNTHGYRLLSVGVMDMFPHTAHVESIALFVK